MGEKSRRKGPAPCHADGKLARTCDHPYVPWGFTPASRAPTAWVGASLSCMGLSAASQAPGLCRDEQSSRISVPHLSGAPILLPDLKGTQLSNFQESSPLPHKQERKDKRSTPEEEGRSAPEKIIQSLKLCPGGHRPASLSSSCPAGCGLSFNLPPGILLSVQKCCTPSSLKTC
ncbi:putative uncharacterized protein LINC02693 isoform X2 [Symphalangus syndactylus]|uniref:putative uncharacterized protein LINC02693 isoform X2 n=1 Tax=Symphalangus syndactylus TaxID=9590 RepID=UPI00244302E3|nr:putative uncharacterized protein LINC02693 isoform X1 [Symphalangus syndactylus]